MAPFDNFVAAVAQALQQRVPKPECPLCKQSQWVINDVPVSAPVFEKTGEVKFPATAMPLAALICRHCGYTALLSLGALGMLRQNTNAGQVAGAGGTPPPAAPGSAESARSGA